MGNGNFEDIRTQAKIHKIVEMKYPGNILNIHLMHF